MDHREPEYLPDSLPLHFRLDVACLRLGAAEGPCARADVRIIPQKLESEWRRLRFMQEQKWALRPVDDMHFELRRAAAIHHSNIQKIHERLTSGARGMLRECVRVLRLQLGPQRELTDADMENFSGRLSVEAIVDLGGDPLLADLNFINEGRSTIFKLLFEVYERYLIQVPDDLTSPRYEMRMAHTAHYDYVLLFPPRPYAKCSLRAPEKHQCVSAAFPVDTDVLEAMYHQEKILVAHATLTFLFWECFNSIFPSDMSHWEKAQTAGKSKAQRLRHCTSREDAMGILWSIMRPSDFRLPFHRTVKLQENTAGGIIEAVQLALHDVALQLEFEHFELMPLAWTAVPGEREDLQWPLVVQHVASDRNESTAALPPSEIPGFHQVKPLVAVSGELATLEYSATLRGELQDMETDEEARETIEDKDVIAVLDLAQVLNKGEITVMQMTGTGHMEIQLALELMAQLEECLTERAIGWPTSSSDQVQDLSMKAAQVAFGLRALQRASIKQQLRDVGLTVFETVRPVQQQEEDTSIAGCCSTACALCGLYCCRCCRRKKVSAKIAADVECEMRRLMFISAPDHVLQQRAEMHKMVCKVCPNRFQTFIGGFKASQFMRSAPTQPFWVEIPTDPYPYHPYFAPSLPSADPASIFSPAERKVLVRSFITDPLSEIRFPDGCVDPRQGGADIDPSELVSEGILDGFLCLGSILLGNHLVDSWILRWRRIGLFRFIVSFSHFRVPSKTLLRNYGPQIASYFEFLAFVAKALVIGPAPLGCFAMYAGLPNTQGDGNHPFWKYVQPIYGLCMVLWGVIFCVMWRRQAAYLGYLWNNGLTRIGEELQSGSSLFSRQKDLRVEFAMHFRKNFDRASPDKQTRILNNMRNVLHVPRGLSHGNNIISHSHSNIFRNVVANEASPPSNIGPPSVAAFGNKQLRSDIDSHIEACYVPISERRRRMLVGDLVSFVFVALSSAITVLSLTVQQWLEKYENKSSLVVSYIVSGVTSGLLIPLLNIVHRNVALSLTEWEAYRKKRDHEASIFYKLFAFDFFNYFNGLFWIAFKHRNMEQLRFQVASIMITMCLWGNWREVVLPLMLKRLRRADALPATLCRAEINHDGPLGRALRQVGDQWTRSDDFILVDEVIELLLQFGMATMFAVAFPLGPLVFLVSCILELRIDAYKLIRLLRFPEPYMSVGIGVPYHAFFFIAVVSLFVNCAILSLTEYAGGDHAGTTGTGLEMWFPNESVKTRVFFVVVLEHTLLAIIVAILSWTSILSSHVREDEFRQQYYEMREDEEYRRDEEDSTSTKSMQAQRSRRRRQAARPVAHTPVCSPREVSFGEALHSSQPQGSQLAVREKPFKIVADLEELFRPATTTLFEVSTAPVSRLAGGTDSDAYLDPSTDPRSAESAPLMGSAICQGAESASETVVEP